MAEKILRRCVIVCASPELSADFIKDKITDSDYIIAADGGMKPLNTLGIVPELFVGDFDSFKGEVPEKTEIIKLNTRKDDTDSMHCAEVALERGFKNIVLLGASGGSASHTFSNYSVLSFLADNGVSALMSDKTGCVKVLREGLHSFRNRKNCEFSLFPFGCRGVTVSYVGDVEYPADELLISENSSLGKSNVFKSDDVNIVVKKGKAIVFYSEYEIYQ